MLANGSLIAGLALGVHRACGLEVVLGLSMGDAQQVLDRLVLTAPRVTLRLRATDREVADQPRTAARVRVDRLHRGSELGVDGHLDSWVDGRHESSVPPVRYTIVR